MNKNKANIFKIKGNKLEQWLTWCEQLTTTRQAEALATIKDEGIVCEFFVTFKIDGTYYTLGAEIKNDQDNQPGSDDNEINLTHKKMKQECLEYVGPGDFSYLIKN